MNVPSTYSAPADWTQWQEAQGRSSGDAFPHLEVALTPRIGSAPASPENRGAGKFVQRPVSRWTQFDPTASTRPVYREAPAMLNEEGRRQYFYWNLNDTVASANAVPEDASADAQADPQPPEAMTALAAACVSGDRQAVQAMLESGEEVNACDHEGLTALDHAVQSGQFAAAEMLAAAGAVWTTSRHDIAELLIPAVKANLPNLLRYALSCGADIAVTDGSGRTPLHHAVLSLRHHFLPCLANARTMAHADGHGNTPLHLAAIARNPLALKTFLDRHAALNVRNWDGNTALSCACAVPSVNAVMLLLRAGADMTVENNFGQRPLHIACLHGHADIVRMLLVLGVDPHVRTAQGETALDIARRGNVPAVASALMLGGATH